ncbi:flagellar biosynthesis protein FlhB [Paenibacillus yanchengensis]|uniref:Flagellar biosynthetic protein FlhB n=1 Tax=Paenibacillus yanchengensis TaxID=2035833 RepID=A0ABW4YMC8_9BACL
MQHQSSTALPMNLQLFSQEKTEKATPKKRSDSRKKGQVAKSADLPGALILLMTFAAFLMLGSYFKQNILQLFSSFFQDWLLMEVTADNVLPLFTSIATKIAVLLLPIFAIVIVIGLVGNVAQFGFLLTGEPLKPQLKKLNPIEGFKKIFSVRSLVEFLKSVFKVSIIAIIVYTTITREWDHILSLSSQPIEHIFNYTAQVTFNLGIQIGAILIVLAFADYMYQRYEHQKSIKMSKQDIKDEFKKTEGDPIIKGRIRERQRKMAVQRMMQEVPTADVIITNPTHYAIALKYDASSMEAPTIVAKGVDHLALKIREIAKEHGVITMENKPLARALYEQAEIGEQIPGDLFQAVAEVLAYVYKLKNIRSSRG